MKSISTRRQILEDQAVGDLTTPTIKISSIAILLGLCLLVFFWGLGSRPFYTRGEPREGLVVWEMYSTGNWILPMVNGEYIPFKPPLFHWVGILASELQGRVDEFSIRFPSALFATLGVLMTYFAGAFLWGERAGLMAGIVLAAIPEWSQSSQNAQVDMILAFFMAAACFYFYFLYQRQKFSTLWALGLPFLLGCATLAKGPVGAVVPSLIFLIFLVLRRDLAFIKQLRPFASTAVFLVVAGSWYGLAWQQGGMAFFSRQIVGETIGTAAGDYGHHQSIFYFVPYLFQNMTPWSFFFPAIALYLYSRRRTLSKEHLSFQFVSIATIFVFFSVALGKRSVYILPLYPATALLVGAWWQKLENGETHALWLTRLLGYLVAACSVLIIAAFALYFSKEYGLLSVNLLAPVTRFKSVVFVLHFLTPPSPWLWMFLALYIAAALLLLWALTKGNWRATFASLAMIAVATTLVINVVYYTALTDERTLKPFMARVRQKVNATTPLVFYRAFDYGAIYYSHRHVPSFAKKVNELTPPLYLLMWEEDWKPLQNRQDFQQLDISEGLGPVGRHHMVLVKSTASPSLIQEISPKSAPKREAENNAD